jgi:hypothetical protein
MRIQRHASLRPQRMQGVSPPLFPLSRLRWSPTARPQRISRVAVLRGPSSVARLNAMGARFDQTSRPPTPPPHTKCHKWCTLTRCTRG